MKNQSMLFENTVKTQGASGFIFFRSYYEALQSLKPRQRHAVLDAMLDIAFTGNVPEMTGTVEAVVKAFAPNLMASRKRYSMISSKKSERQEASETANYDKTSMSAAQKSHEKNVTDKDKDKDKDRDKDAEKEAQRESRAKSSPPSGGNTRAAQNALSEKIICDYAGEDAELKELLFSWVDIRRERSQPTNPQTIRLNLAELTRLTSGGSVKDYLREVVRRGWGTFFELESGAQSKAKQSKNAKKQELCERSFDLEEFDDYTLGITK